MEFCSLDEAWVFWKNYSRKMGFDVRKHYANKSKKYNMITSRRFLCSKEGHRETDKRDDSVKDHRAEIRNDCPVRLGVTLNRSNNGEVGCLLKYFQRKTLEDPSFFYAVQLDHSEQVTNIFWADARMRIDYDIFGDVITFDTTFSTNKEYRPFGVFIGFNHHRGLIVFGAALLYDETAESFAWLFETFLEAHKSKKPKTIFTDQDAAMAKALSEVFPETRHGLCTWHLMQNGIKHLGNLMKDGSCFLSDFKKAMFENEDDEKFEEAWEMLISSYSLTENSWIKAIYKIKEKWAKCYMKTTITLGMRSTQLSESLNGDLKDYLKSSLDLNNFFKHFERVVSDKRYKELQSEYEIREKMPKLKVKTVPILIQAGNIYTRIIFEKFQVEWEKSLSNFIMEKNEAFDFREFLISSFNEGGEYKVIYHPFLQTTSCQCMMYETFGILCSHILKVLDIIDIKLVSDKYILKRWTRKARDEILEKSNRNVQVKLYFF
ncbi:Protein FAR1-RELATED SEQUENCE 5 [Platanthera zijinensis]|uniref:Protein FAR1-RELATED SEQUENCE 5 n=1 Tax=Platanthera zijinensis TaxID=2320716 RepID=A0AAP0BHE5_9ASPA